MHSYTLTTLAHADSCRSITKAALSIIREYIFSEDTLHSFDLLLTEAIANCARHAYKYSEIGNVEIIIDIEPGQSISCNISDWGSGFYGSKIDIAHPTLSLPEEEGGRGLYIIASLATSFKITSENGKNTVHATLDIPRGLWVR